MNEPSDAQAVLAAAGTRTRLSRQQKAAIVIGALGAEAAGPLLEQLDEGALRSFTAAMTKLRRVDPADVRHTIAEFIEAVADFEEVVRGGISRTREMLSPHINDNLLTQLLDDVDTPTLRNVWTKLAKVDEDALADFLSREHPQTAAVVLSKLGNEKSAKVLNRFEPDRAREVVLGIPRISILDPKVIEAIGASVSRDFLTAHQHSGPRRDPAGRVSSILNFTGAQLRDRILADIEQAQPDFAEEIRRKMFTFDDIPRRIGPRDVPAIVREVRADCLLRALRFAMETNPESVEFILGNISSRVSEQMREDLAALEKPKRKDGEDAQAEVIATIRALESRNQLSLISQDEDG